MPNFSDNQKKTSSDSKRHFRIVIGSKEHGLYISSTPSSAALIVATELCSSNKGKNVEFYIREITHGSKKKTYGPYIGKVEKLKNLKFKGDGIKSYKIVAKLKKVVMKGGEEVIDNIVISYGDCGKLHMWSIKTYSKKCVILTYGNQRITIGSHDSPGAIQVKYFNNTSSMYYNKDKFFVKNINLHKFSSIINQKLLNYSYYLANNTKYEEFLQKNEVLINKILTFIDIIPNPQIDISLIKDWLNNAKSKLVDENEKVNLPPPPPYQRPEPAEAVRLKLSRMQKVHESNSNLSSLLQNLNLK